MVQISLLDAERGYRHGCTRSSWKSRRGANIDLIVSAILYGAGASNHSVQKVYLYDVDIGPCVDCRACKENKYKCALGDSMQMLCPKLEEANVIVFGAPLHWYGPSAKMELLVDRLRPFVSSKKLNGKKVLLVIPSEVAPKLAPSL